MKKKKILIIGLGKIGLNHLKSAIKFKKKVKIYIFDKRNIKENILKNKNVNILKNLESQNTYDLVIISTNSEERFALFLQLVKNNIVKNILFEKFVYFKKNQFEKTIKIIKKKKINAWVNCIRREISIFDKLKSKLPKKFELIFQYKNWGMACNSIHFLDLFSFLSGYSKVNVSETNLDKKIYRSKRKSYMEFKGTIKFRVNNCSLLIEDRNIFNNKIFKIVSKNKIFYFNKNENSLTEKNFKTNSLQKFKCEYPRVSLVSYKLINKILNDKKINLTSINESFYHHRILIDLFSKHLKKIKYKNKLKIT